MHNIWDMSGVDTKFSQRIGFLLVPNFALMSYASAIEPLRAANLIAGKDLYKVTPLSVGGAEVRSSSGVSVICDDLFVAGGDCHTIFVCAGGLQPDWALVQSAHPLLRKLSRQGVRVGGISSGAYLLAEAGLLDNKDFTIHWEHALLLKERFPQLSPRQTRYVIDGDRVTCAGGVAPLDMMHAIIGERMGSHFARRVSDWFLHTAVSAPGASQRGSLAERYGTNHSALLSILEKMEATLERPLSRVELAKLVGISVRHVDRLFKAHLKDSFRATYRNLRLDHARRLLEHSPLSIGEIALATGFSSTGHFSHAFRSRFGRSPSGSRSKTAH